MLQKEFLEELREILSEVPFQDDGIGLLLALRMVEYARGRAKATGRPEDLHPSDLEDVRALKDLVTSSG